MVQNPSKIRECQIGWKKNQGPSMSCLLETYFKYKDTNKLNVKGVKAYTMLTV